MKKTKKITALVLAVMMAGSLGACGGSGSSSEKGGGSGPSGEGTHLNFSCYNYSNSMDPITNVNSSWCFLRYGIGECLFRFDENVVVE